MRASDVLTGYRGDRSLWLTARAHDLHFIRVLVCTGGSGIFAEYAAMPYVGSWHDSEAPIRL
jgi:hypothetical protein